MSFRKLDYTPAHVKHELPNSDGTENDLMALLARADQPTPWAFDDFIVRGDQVMIAGAPKAGKSWLALQLSLAAASGGQFLRWHAAAPMKTLYINMEVGEIMWSKRVCKLIGGAENAAPYIDQFWCINDIRSVNILDPEARKPLQERIKKGGYEFVVVDVLSRCHYADENDNGLMKQVLLALRVLCGDATHVVVHHSRKPPPGSEHVNLGASSIRGASSIVGEVDMAMTLVVRAGQGARYSLQIAARNVEEPDEMLLERDAETMRYKEHQGQESNLDEIIQTLFKGGHSLPRKDVQQAVADGLGITFETARKTIKSAVERGLIEESRQGNHYFYFVPESSPVLRVVNGSSAAAYRAASDGDDCPF